MADTLKDSDAAQTLRQEELKEAVVSIESAGATP